MTMSIKKSEGFAMVRNGLLAVLAASALASGASVSQNYDNQNTLRERYENFMARNGIQIGGIAEAEYYNSTVTGSLSNPDKETGDKKQTTWLDLDIQAKPWDEIGGRVILRFQQDWQTYFSNRSRPIGVRWMQIDGNIANKFNYTVGDFQEKWSRLTLYAPELRVLMEPEIYAKARKEAQQEEWVEDNKRTMQGAKFNAALNVGSDNLLELRLDGYLSRVRRAEFLDSELQTVDAFKQPITTYAKHGHDFMTSDLEQFSFGANFEALVKENIIVGASLVNTWEDPETYKFSPTMADSGVSINGIDWRNPANGFAHDNTVISARAGIDVGAFLNDKLILELVGEYAMSNMKYSLVSNAAYTSINNVITNTDDATLAQVGAEQAAGTAVINSIDTVSPGLYNLNYDKVYLTIPEDEDYNAINVELGLGWGDKGEDQFWADVRGYFVQVDSGFTNILAQSPTFRGDRIMNTENDLSSLGIGSPLYSTFDAMYHIRRKNSPLSNYQYQQAPFMQNSYTSSIGTTNFSADRNVQGVLPFGHATPDRKGFDVDAMLGSKDGIEAHVVFRSFEEMDADATIIDPDKFSEMGGGIGVDLYKLMPNMDKKSMRISGSWVQSKIDNNFLSMAVDASDPANPVFVTVANTSNFVSTFINAGIYASLTEKFALLGGFQMINSEDKVNDNLTSEIDQMQWRGGMEYKMKDGAYLQFSLGQINVDQTAYGADQNSSADDLKSDFSQFLTQVKVRASF